MRLALVLCFGFSSLALGGCEIITDGAMGEIFGDGGPELVWMQGQGEAPAIDHEVFE